MTTQSERQAVTSNAGEQSLASGEIGMAVVWAVFYTIVIIVPVASKFAPVGTIVALLSK